MSENSHKPVRFAIAHLFTTGRDPSRDSILHIACKRYSEKSSPQINDWIVNPEETIKKRVWRRTGISTKQAKDAPLWDEIRDKVLSFLEDIDVIFVRNSDIAAEWFEGIVYRDKTAPTLVDLNEMYQFFLPEEPVPYSDAALIDLGTSMRPSEGDRKLHKILAEMTCILDRILEIILSREKINTKTYHPVYSLFAWALSVDENQSSFHALFKIVTGATRIQWAKRAWIEGIYYDNPVKLKEDELRKFIKNWSPSNLIEEDRKPFDENYTRTNPIRDEGLRLCYELADKSRSVEGKKLDRREEQREYSRFIQRAINIGGSYAIEAGTGTGKTLGYLIPACEHLRENEDRQVIVATATINLMDQIVTKEWLNHGLYSSKLHQYGQYGLMDQIVTKEWTNLASHDLRIATLKGKRNYLCTSALKRLFNTLNSVENEQDKSQKEIHSDDRLAWLCLFQILTRNNGQWDNVDDFTKKYPRISKEFEVDLDAESACKPKLCRMGKHCSFPQAVRRAQFAHVLITNHHKLTKLDDEIRKRASVCIIDEADQFPDNLRNALSESLSKKDMIDFAHRVAGTKKRRGFVQILRDGLKETRSKCESALESLSKIEDLDDLKSELSEILSEKDMIDFDRRMARTEERRDFVQILCDKLEKTQSMCERALDSPILSKIEKSCHQVIKYLWNSTKDSAETKEKRWKDLHQNRKEILKKTLEKLAEKFCNIEKQFCTIGLEWRQIEQFTPKIFGVRKTEFFDRINTYIYDAEEFGAIANSLISAIASNEFVVTYDQKAFDWMITKIPFSIANNVKSITGSFETVVLTSGTLYVDETLDLLSLELLDDEEASKDLFVADSKIMSPFNYHRKVCGASTPFIVGFNYKFPNKKWEHQILAAIALQSLVLDGRTLVLFNNWAEMQKMYKRIYPVFQKFGIPLLLQDRVGSSEAIIQEFAGLEESVLFGTGRFWTGVDFPGPTLTQLMIVRLPNKDWTSPLVVERRERWPDKKFDSWYTQNTKRKLRQGFGRLMRSDRDEGVFIMMDSRILNDARMRACKEAIPVLLNSKFESALKLAEWAVKRCGLSPELEERGIDMKTSYQQIEWILNQ